MTEEQITAVAEKVNTGVANKFAEETKKLEAKFKEFEAAAAKGNVKAEDIATLKAEVDKSQEKLEGILTKQGESITKLEEKLMEVGKEDEPAEKVFEENITELKAIQKSGTGQMTFNVGMRVDKNGQLKLVVTKAADVHNTTTVGANASVTQNMSALSLLRSGNGDMIETIQRDRPWILEFVSVGNSTAAAHTWYDEVPKQGDFAVTAEGATKPLTMYTFNRTSTDYRKAAGRGKLTEEFNNDLPALVAQIYDLMRIDCRNVMNNLILTSMIAEASPYVNASLALQVDNADDWAAIAAVSGQLGNGYYTPNVLVMNQNKGIIAAASKDTTGQYIDYGPLMNEINAGNLKTIKHPSVGLQKFFLGDGNIYKVLLKGDIQVRIGWSNDDFDKNQFSVVVEQFFFNYVSQARKAGLVYADFAAVKTAIEKP